jgi:hypothetical protein
VDVARHEGAQRVGDAFELEEAVRACRGHPLGKERRRRQGVGLVGSRRRQTPPSAMPNKTASANDSDALLVRMRFIPPS